MLRLALKRLSSTTELTPSVPPKLRLALSSSTAEFTLNSQKTVSDLLAEIQGEDARITSVKILNDNKEALPENFLCSELTNNSFFVEINGQFTEVYPGLSQFIRGNEKYFAKCREAGIPFNDARTICTYLEHLEREIGANEEINDFETTSQRVLEHMNEQKHHEIKVLRNQLLSYSNELRPLEEELAQLELRAERATNRVLGLGLATMTAQWGAICYGTFLLYGWDVMEPVSYMVGATWAVLGYSYFLKNKEEFEINSFEAMIRRNKFRKLLKQSRVDIDKITLLKKNIETINNLIAVLS